ncbi:response regulator [Streptomyces sp. NPDC056975]|uniref:response regulator n=1 Tax=unclassified Streptomyces TaxID=2593676 RepID=UPI0036363983
MRVLVVEDEVRTAELLRRGLTEEGYAVDVAADGPDAVWQAREVFYDLIVLDVMLPGLHGFEVCRRPRADGRWTPVLVVHRAGLGR